MPQSNHAIDRFGWWSNLRHGGLLFDLSRLSKLLVRDIEPLRNFDEDRLRRRIIAFTDSPHTNRNDFVTFILESICGFTSLAGQWLRGTEVSAKWSRKALTGQILKPKHLWLGLRGGLLPVFIEDVPRIGIGKGKKAVSDALQWLRASEHSIALITNGHEWRLVFAGLDYEAYCEWDIGQWLSEGRESPEFLGLRALLDPEIWSEPAAKQTPPIVAAINDSRKGQAELSQVLGERVRQAAERLIDAHGQVFSSLSNPIAPQDIYRAGVRVIMRMVVVLFAESRNDLLPRDNPVYHDNYSIQGLSSSLERIARHRLAAGYSAYPRLLALFRLIHAGCSHESLLIPAYSGQLFQSGDADSSDGLLRALSVFEQACFSNDCMNDAQVYQLIDLLTRTQIRIRQGRATLLVPSPVDFSGLDSEYIGILYEGLLDFELRTAPANCPIIVLAVGNQPSLPLSTLESMTNAALKTLLEKLKDTSSDSASGDEESDDETGDSEDNDNKSDEESEAEEITEVDAVEEEIDEPTATDTSIQDQRHSARTRAEAWARRAIEVGKLVRKPTGKLTPERQQQYETAIATKAKQLVLRVVVPGEWYLVRWGGTRKGSGTFYTRPQLAIPTVHRTLKPLCYIEQNGEWVPRTPETILALKVCDPACGSGTFPLTSLRFLTNALWDALVHHNRFQAYADHTIIQLIQNANHSGESSGSSNGNGNERDSTGSGGGSADSSSFEDLPCRPDDDQFESRTRAALRRYVVERCIYGVDYDPLAVELCRLSLWIETLDRRLPFTFLDHKIKCGNSLVGTWFDQFMHYPAMAWMREGGDKNHTNGRHYVKEAWTTAIKGYVTTVKDELKRFIDGGQLFQSADLTQVQSVHDVAEQALRDIHGLGIHETDLRAEKYQHLRDSAEFRALQDAFDVWCSIWFWPPDQLEHCPLPMDFANGKISEKAREIARAVAKEQRFFHWEIEFPDVFTTGTGVQNGGKPKKPLLAQAAGAATAGAAAPNNTAAKPLSSELSNVVSDSMTESSLAESKRHKNWVVPGFDAILGNPPWDIAKPNSKEFFSAIDPLYRTYGKQEAVLKQTAEFDLASATELSWLSYNANFRARSNWVKFAGTPFGDKVTTKLQKDGTEKREHDLGLGDRGSRSFESSAHRHRRWREKREESTGYADAEHAFQHQGSGDLNLYKMFCEQSHALLRQDGRLGFIVPSGIYSDHGTGELRRLFLDRCRWEWLFGFENREGIFEIHRSFKFNPIILEKGGETSEIRTAFMRRDLADWENAEAFVTMYPRKRILQFSPRSRAILEIQSQRDLEVLEKIYSNSVLLGDTSPNGWGIKYATEFHMTSDSKLFPPRTEWESKGYRPDEYSRWIKGNWQERTDASPAPVGCKRVDIPEGIFLSRCGNQFIHEDDIATDEFKDKKGHKLTGQAMALPVYEGRMIGLFDFSQKGWVSGKGRTAVWTEVDWPAKEIRPQYLMSTCNYLASIHDSVDRLDWSSECWSLSKQAMNTTSFMDIGSATNERTMIASPALLCPYGNSAPLFRANKRRVLLSSILASTVYDFMTRFRCSGLHLNWCVVEETALPILDSRVEKSICEFAFRLFGASPHFNIEQIRFDYQSINQFAITAHERLRCEVLLTAVVAIACNVEIDDFKWMNRECDLPTEMLASNQFTRSLPPKGFWRTDKSQRPELRRTVLAQVAFADALGANSSTPFELVDYLLNQNDGEGWQLPEQLRLSDYGLGHDARAREYQPVRECFGPRFYDWQLEQSAEESWRECHLHARNLLGTTGYASLLAELSGDANTASSPDSASTNESARPPTRRGKAAKPTPLFDNLDDLEG